MSNTEPRKEIEASEDEAFFELELETWEDEGGHLPSDEDDSDLGPRSNNNP